MTLERSQNIIGKNIFFTNPENRNSEYLLQEVEMILATDYDNYTKVLMPRIYGDDEAGSKCCYNNVIKPLEQELRGTYVLYDSKGNVTAHCYPKNTWFDVPTFGNDENRPIYFVEK